MTPEQRLQEILDQAKQKDIEKAERKTLENDLYNIYRSINTLASIITDNIRNLLFTELDNFLLPQGWISEPIHENGRDYNLDLKNICITPLENISTRKEGFLVSHNLFENKKYRIEVTFKDSNINEKLTKATQGLIIRNNTDNNELFLLLSNLQSIQNDLNLLYQTMDVEMLEIDIVKIGQKHYINQSNFIEALLGILENK